MVTLLSSAVVILSPFLLMTKSLAQMLLKLSWRSELILNISSLFSFGVRTIPGVSFTDKLTKERVLEKGIIKIESVPVFVGDADFKMVIVKIYEAAAEMPDMVLIGRLSHYGCVLSF